LNTGKSRWRVQIADTLGAAVPHWGFTTSPLVTRDTVVVLTGGSPHRAITAFDKRTGTVVWQRGSDGASYQSPVLATVAGTSASSLAETSFSLRSIQPTVAKYGATSTPVADSTDRSSIRWRLRQTRRC
jgi:outer membrane protein assembly factor BamB